MNRTLSFLIVCVALTARAQNPSPQPTAPDAQVRLGYSYLEQKDYAMALSWFRKAAEQGNAAAQNNIGWLYHNAWGVKQDYTEAMRWYRKAADQGNSRAQANIGQLYQKGLGVQQDYAEAMTWYRKAADQGNTNAQVSVGWFYQNGWGVQQDYSEAMKWYLGAANKGNAYAQNNLGLLYEKGLGVDRDYAVAMAWYFRAADQGDAQAQDNLGLLYRNGLGDRQDYVKAMTWFRKAADQGFAKAQVHVGWLYENGLGVPRDAREAMAWYRKAADQGDADGQNNVGWLYQNGHGVKQDYAEAMTWYRKAVEQGNDIAQNNIGWLYQNGWGVQQDYIEAMAWYRKAAAQNNAQAKANLESLPRLEFQDDSAHATAEKDLSTSSTPDDGSAPVLFLANGIRAPRVLNQPDPAYAEEARAAGLSGEVLLSLMVGPDGQPRDVKVLAPLGAGLDEKAVDAVKTWKFDPATKDGQPVAVRIMVQVDFRLDEPSSVGKVEIVDDPQPAHLASYLSPAILETSKCWSKATQDKTRAPSLKQGQVTIQFGILEDGKISSTEIASSSGDDVLDRDARDCVSALAIQKPLPAELNRGELKVRMQLLYNAGEIMLNPYHPQVAAGGREQFYFEMAGTLSKAADWSVTGAGCAEAACGTISPDGVYTAPTVLPKPPYVRVTGTLAGANPITASAVVALVEKL